jgi:Family of unknown function (DUF6152)
MRNSPRQNIAAVLLRARPAPTRPGVTMRQPVARRILGAIAALTLIAMPIWVSAHHSSAMFDPSRTVTLQGVVEEFRWTNPHATLQVLVKSDQGPEEGWSIEMNSPEHLARAGWRSDSLQTGDAVSLVIHPARDAINGGQFVSGTGPRGPLIDGPPPPPISALTLSPTVVTSSCPKVEVTLVEPSASSDARPVKLGTSTVFVRRKAITTTSDISEMKLAGDDADTLIQIKYTEPAAARLLDATTDHDGLKLAFVVDDDVWLAFTWRGSHGIEPDGTQVSIRNGLAKAQRLMESIRACSDAHAE